MLRTYDRGSDGMSGYGKLATYRSTLFEKPPTTELTPVFQDSQILLQQSMHVECSSVNRYGVQLMNQSKAIIINENRKNKKSTDG